MPIARAALVTGHAPLIPHGLLVADTVLCPCTGIAAWLVWRRIDIGLDRKRAALRRWGWMLMVSALWPNALYVVGNRPLAAACALAAMVACFWTSRAFQRLRPVAAVLLVPYALLLGSIAGVLIAHF